MAAFRNWKMPAMNISGLPQDPADFRSFEGCLIKRSVHTFCAFVYCPQPDTSSVHWIQKA